jgi:hypothetical protein
MPIKRKRAENVGLRFSETMSGYLAEGVEDFGNHFFFHLVSSGSSDSQEIDRKPAMRFKRHV